MPIREKYHNWIIALTTGWCEEHGAYSRLMETLHSYNFTYEIPRDSNRAADGIDFRLKFSESDPDYTYRDVQLYLDGPCTVLEMMAALATRCEDSIMKTIEDGDRTAEWFWHMIGNMHLDGMTDDNYDPTYVKNCIINMLNRAYEANGDGGLFTVNTGTDLRKMEIWYQMNWYLSELLSLK